MKQLFQPDTHTCGQTCVAMLAKTSVEEAIKAVGVKTGTHGTHLIRGLMILGLSCSDKSNLLTKNKQFPSKAIVRVQPVDRKVNKWRGHWVAVEHGLVYDPDIDRDYHPFRENLGIRTIVPLYEYVTLMNTIGHKFTSFIGVD